MGEQANNTATSVDSSIGFTGNVSLKLDSANRVAIPAKFKDVLDKHYGVYGSQVVVLPDSDGKLKVLPMPAWQKLQDRLSTLSEFDPSADELRAYLVGNMEVCSLDVQNRIRLTQNLCDVAGLAKDVVIVGQLDKMEIWNAEAWTKFKASTAKDFKSKMADVFRNLQSGGK